MVEERNRGDRNAQHEEGASELWIVFALLAGLLIAALVHSYGLAAWRWYFNPNSALSIVERKDIAQGAASVVQALAVLLAGAAALIGIYFTRLTLLHSQETLRSNQEETQMTMQLSADGQITERFTRAIDQLGDDKLQVRLGAIYALGRIAKDSEKDYWPIMEVLTAHLRERYPFPSSEGTVEIATNSPTSRRKLAPVRGIMPTQQIGIVFSDIETQAVINVLRRRARYFQHGEDERLKLSVTDLTGVILSGAHLEKAMFYGSCLEVANFAEAHLEGAQFHGAQLKSANFEGAHLRDAIFAGVDLSRVRNLTQEQVNQAYGDFETKLPKGINHPASWLESIHEQESGESGTLDPERIDDD